jgi:hypothetical protein
LLAGRVGEMRKAICSSFVFAMIAAAQPQIGYVDIFVAKVKPEKRPEFDALGKRIADANRKNKGDNFTCSEIVYGEQNTFFFTSARANLAGIDEGTKAFESALGKTFGATAGKVMEDVNRCLISSHGELRRVRTDLSSGSAEPSALFKAVGESRFVRTAIVRVRPGRGPNFEEQLKMTQSLGSQMRLVSQSAAGQTATIYYITGFGKSMADLDTPTLPQLLGNQYAQYSKMSAENVLGVETIISRYVPELSNPPEAIAAADPGFWNPKPKAAPAKPKAAPPTGN